MNTIKCNLKHIMVAVFAVALLAVVLPGMKSEAASSGRYVKITASAVNVHTGPSTANNVEGTLKYGDTARVVSWPGTWIEVEYDGGIGYILYNSSWETMYWGDDNNGNNGGGTITWYDLGSNYIAECTASTLYVHSSPSVNASKTGYLVRGQIVTATKESLRWVKIAYYNTYGNYTVGYVARAYVSLQQKAQYTGESFYSLNGTVKVDVNDLFVHKTPALTSTNRFSTDAKNGSTFKVLAQSEHWYRINYNGQNGYVVKQYVVYYAQNLKLKLSDTSIVMDKNDSTKVWIKSFKSMRSKMGITKWTWKSSKSSVVKVTKNYKKNTSKTYCMIKGKKAGSAKLYFYYKIAGQWHRISCKVKVVNPTHLGVVDDDPDQ